jgi:hypothetical protein
MRANLTADQLSTIMSRCSDNDEDVHDVLADLGLKFDPELDACIPLNK